MSCWLFFWCKKDIYWFWYIITLMWLLDLTVMCWTQFALWIILSKYYILIYSIHNSSLMFTTFLGFFDLLHSLGLCYFTPYHSRKKKNILVKWAILTDGPVSRNTVVCHVNFHTSITVSIIKKINNVLQWHSYWVAYVSTNPLHSSSVLHPFHSTLAFIFLIQSSIKILVNYGAITHPWLL